MGYPEAVAQINSSPPVSHQMQVDLIVLLFLFYSFSTLVISFFDNAALDFDHL